MARRPTIAITCSVGDIRSGRWEEHAAYSPITYVRAVQRAGARAILLAADPQALLNAIDGLILSGGGEGLDVTGRAMRDDSPEAIEDPTARFLLGVLWHPEEDERSRVVGSLVDAARERQRSLGR